MKLDLAFTLVDVCEGEARQWYRDAAGMMVESARHAFAGHDLRIVQMTDSVSQVVEGAETFIRSACVELEQLAQFRGKCTADWALQTDRPTILCDVDVLWNNDGITQVMEGNCPDIALFSRKGNPFQAFNGGLIVTQPNQTEFWTVYKAMMNEHLPTDVRKWWGDQIALTCMVGTPEANQSGSRRHGSTVGYVPIDLVAPSPKTHETPLLNTSAVHFKGSVGGKRKSFMFEYFTMLQASWGKREAAE